MRDADMIDKARRGDPETVGELVRIYYPSVLRFLTTLCANSADAEELTQEAFVKALKGLKRFRGESRPSEWLHRIAYYEFTHHRRAWRPTVPLPEGASPLFETSSVLALDLEAALRKVPEGFRTAFVLCDVQGLTMAEAAEVTGVPLGTAKSRLYAARGQLAALLEPERKEKKDESRV